MLVALHVSQVVVLSLDLPDLLIQSLEGTIGRVTAVIARLLLNMQILQASAA
jgi:hypothetical protein